MCIYKLILIYKMPCVLHAAHGTGVILHLPQKNKIPQKINNIYVYKNIRFSP